VVTYRLKIMPYGPAGIAFSPNRWPRIMAAKESTVERTVETTTKD
jgi:hypothetical protein